MGAYDGEIEPDALEFLADASGGDARAALNAVELGILTTERSADGKIHIDLAAGNRIVLFQPLYLQQQFFLTHGSNSASFPAAQKQRTLWPSDISVMGTAFCLHSSLA